MWNKYPYINYNDLNLDFILKAIKEMEHKVNDFVSLNAVKYANPIQWNITKQYEKNTIVIDALTGTAFISVQPVPSGVSLTRTQYWTVVFDLSQFVTKAASNFANSYERDITTTATMPTGAGDWLVWNSTLYVALTNIHAGDAYVVNGNIKRMTVEDFYDLLMESIRALDDRIDGEIRDRQGADTALGGRIDGEIRDRQDADTALGGRIDGEIRDRRDADNAINATIGDLANLTTPDKSTIVNAINSAQMEINTIVSQLIYFNVKEYGAIGDGTHDDTDAFKNAIADARANGGGVVFVPFPTNFYLITDTLTLDGKIYVLGEGLSTIKFNSSILFDCSRKYGGLTDLHITSINGTGTAVHFDISQYVCYTYRFKHLEIENCTHAFDDVGLGSVYVVDMIFEDILMTLGNGDQIVSNRSRGFMTFHNVKVDWTYNTSLCPYFGAKFVDVAGLELEKFDVVGPVPARVAPQYTPNQTGLYIEGVSGGDVSVWLSRINIDTTYGRGIIITNVRFVQGDLIECFATYGLGLFLNGCNMFSLSNVYLVHHTSSTESVTGLSIINCLAGLISNLLCRYWKGNGIVIENSEDIHISNGFIDSSNGRSLVEVGTSNKNVISNVTMSNAGSPNIIVGAQTHIVNSILEGIFTADSHA